MSNKKRNTFYDGSETVSGLVPNNENPKFIITTANVENFIDGKLNTINDALKQMSLSGIPSEIRTTISAMDISKKFSSFMLILPEDVMFEYDTEDFIPPEFDSNGNIKTEGSIQVVYKDTKGKKKHKEREKLDISDEGRIDLRGLAFNKSINNDVGLRMRTSYYNMLEDFMYEKSDIATIMNQQFRRSMQISQQAAAFIKSYRHPKIYKMGKSKYVLVVLDPLKVFHKMLRYKNDEQKYSVRIVNIKKLSNAGEMAFEVIREVNKKRKHGKNDPNKDLIKMINMKLK